MSKKLVKKLVSKNLEILSGIRYIGTIYSDGGNTEAVCKYKQSKTEKKLATKKETSNMIATKVTDTSVTLKANDWRAAVKTVYVPTQLVLQWTGAKTKEDIDLSQEYELSVGLKGSKS